LNAPISSLLADAPPPEPLIKRPRVDPNGLQVPKDQTAEVQRLLALPAPEDLRIVSWNIDGLDEEGGPEGTMRRTLAAALHIARQRPAAVLLQEIIPPALELLAAKPVLGGVYDIVVPDNPPQPYYVAILLDRRRVRQLGKPITITFPTSQMGRQLLSVCVEHAGHPPLVIATAHLESMKDHGAERKRQLTHSLRFLRGVVGQLPAGASQGTPPVGAALMGGDFNIRDEEVKAVCHEAVGFADAWLFCGSPKDAQWTWDTAANDNLRVSYTCRTRFDRMFFLSPGVSDAPSQGLLPQPKARGKAKAAAKVTSAQGGGLVPSGWRPTSFSLLGKERVPVLNRFPSDHWGLLVAWKAVEQIAEEQPKQTIKDSLVAGLGATAKGSGTANGSTTNGGEIGGATASRAMLPSLKPARAVIDLDD